MPVSPTYAIVAGTDQCNARCIMCEIRKEGHTDEMRSKSAHHVLKVGWAKVAHRLQAMFGAR